MSSHDYVGSELEVFALAKNWKAYWTSRVMAHLKGSVLEVGAGLGTNTELLCNSKLDQWLCIEPDQKMAEGIQEKIQRGPLPSFCRVFRGTVENLPQGKKFDTIVYIDVLEHIEDHGAELEKAVAHLQTGGKLIVLSPAFPFLYTPFDWAIGHFRRYTKKTLREAIPPGLHLIDLKYLDLVGMSALLVNKFFFRSPNPTPFQVLLWDRVLVPLSRVMDPLWGYGAGKTILGIWQL